jgi:hypothetical protein
MQMLDEISKGFKLHQDSSKFGELRELQLNNNFIVLLLGV